jgi:thiosulfate/3-mercaptopyruvate sulfurtransferase
VAVLDGGFAKWLAENRPTAGGDETRPAAHFSGSPQSAMAVAAADLHDTPSDRWRLVDARSPERYRGDHEPLDRVGGHIPGALNRHYKTNLGPSGTFKTREQLRQELDALLGGAPIERVVCYCGSGVTACHNLLALEHAGLQGAKLYPGSWSEWASEKTRPIETGEHSPGRKS